MRHRLSNWHQLGVMLDRIPLEKVVLKVLAELLIIKRDFILIIYNLFERVEIKLLV